MEKFLSHSEKQLESSSLFKSKVKLKLLAFENEITYLQNILPNLFLLLLLFFPKLQL